MPTPSCQSLREGGAQHFEVLKGNRAAAELIRALNSLEDEVERGQRNGSISEDYYASAGDRISTMSERLGSFSA